MTTALLVSSVLLWLAVLSLGFVLLGAFEAMERLRWQMELLRAMTPTRLGRGGLKPGRKAPDFRLPTVVGPEVALSDYAGRKVFLVFVQAGCGPCGAVVPDLNRMYREGKYQLLVVNNADREKARAWADEVKAEFPVLLQDKWAVSRQYEVMATPFAFLIYEGGVVRSRGVASNKKFIGFVLEGRRDAEKEEHVEAAAGGAGGAESNGSERNSQVKEVQHV
jgi:peroxiredoxin